MAGDNKDQDNKDDQDGMDKLGQMSTPFDSLHDKGAAWHGSRPSLMRQHTQSRKPISDVRDLLGLFDAKNPNQCGKKSRAKNLI